MNSRSRRVSVWKSLDWVTIIIYILLLAAGWLSVCGASYDYGDYDFFDLSTRAGKQLLWIGFSFVLGFVLLMLDDDFYNVFSYFFYFALIGLLVLTIFVAKDVKGSRSWLQFGQVSLQPAEFAKFATALALAKFMSSFSFNMRTLKDAVVMCAIFLLPMVLIILQKETGSALVYLSFFLVLYREGMPGGVLFVGLCAIVFFIVGIKFDDVFMADSITSVGQLVVLLLIIPSAVGLMNVYAGDRKNVWFILGTTVLAMTGAFLISAFIPFNLVYVGLVLCGLLVLYFLYLFLAKQKYAYLIVALFTVGSVGFLYSSNYVFDNVLEPHHQVRIKLILGMEEDLSGAGYNVHQSKIAIGSGGLTGKGFLNGTQTKLKYVPEQDTDFIFCTIGEEQGFIGTVAVLLLFLFLILRLVYLAERQHATFGRVYGYSVLSIFLFHLIINVGMVIGLTPVIGIPLPFFSYGGSSLWGFTLLLFIFLRIDAGRERNR